MSHKKVYDVVSAIVPCRHMTWGDEKKPRLPWAVYSGDDKIFGADDQMYAVRHDWTVELYQQRRDAELERKMDEAINAAFGTFTKRESYIKSEGMLLVAYDFREIEGVQPCESFTQESASSDAQK